MIHGLKMLTEAQRKARNGKVQRTTFGPLALCVEIPAGWRKGASFLTAHYGYISGTKAPDGAAIDMFLSPQASVTADVFVIDHMKGGKFDEPKVFLGFTSKVDAEETYRNVYAQRATATKMTMTQFQQWMKEGGAMQPTIKEEPKLQKVYWDSNGDPDVPMTEILYQIRKTDPTSLALEPLTLDDIYGDADEIVELDALVVPMMRLERVAGIMQNQMKRYGSEALNFQVSKPFKKNGTAQVAVVYELADGQTISIYFHNPDVTPAKIAPQDELISWKWMLNKKDITILVAPEKGQDLDPREVMRRVAKIAIKNRPTFERNNAARVERVARVEALKSEIVVLEKEVEDKTHTLEILRMKIEEKRNMPEPEPEPVPEPEVTPEEEATPEPEVTSGSDDAPTQEVKKGRKSKYDPAVAAALEEKIANLNSFSDVRDLQTAIRDAELSRNDKKRIKELLEQRVSDMNHERYLKKQEMLQEFGEQLKAAEFEEELSLVEAFIRKIPGIDEEHMSHLYTSISDKRRELQIKKKEEERKAAGQAKQAEPAPEEPKKETREERVTRLHDAVMVLINSATSIEDIRKLKKSATFNEFRYVTEDTSRAADFSQQRESIRTALYAKSAELSMPLYNEIMGEIQAATDESGVLAALEKVEIVRNDFPPSQRNEITQAAEARIEALKAAPEPQATPLPEVQPPMPEEPASEPVHEPASEPVAEQPAEVVNATPLNDPVNPQEAADRAYLETFDPATADDARLEEIAARYTSGEMLELLGKALAKYEEYMVSAAEESMK
nr:MAG TPA: Internal head protein [Bacteriophage sp.]